MNDSDLLNALEKLHDSRYGWVFIPELRVGTGYGRSKEQRLDAWAINCWDLQRLGAPLLRRAFEIKISVSDVRKELLNPDKRWMAYTVSHEFWFVTPKGLIDPKLLMKDDGLWEYDGARWHVAKAPRQREGMMPRWTFVASLARRLKIGRDPQDLIGGGRDERH
jgi:hypothetical protein